jgi:predicted phosphodiesterase
MKYKKIKVNKETIIVVGDIHEHEPQFDEIVELFKPNENKILVSLGDIYGKGFGTNSAESIINKLILLNKNKASYTICGNYDYKQVRKAYRDDINMSEQLLWIDAQPWSISFEWPNGKILLVLHGGVTKKHTHDDLNNSDIMYIKNWHEEYDGRFGYICAGHDAQKDGVAKFYKYSCNIDTACYYTGVLTCQEFNESGLGTKFVSSGVPYDFRNI